MPKFLSDILIHHIETKVIHWLISDSVVQYPPVQCFCNQTWCLCVLGSVLCYKHNRWKTTQPCTNMLHGKPVVLLQDCWRWQRVKTHIKDWGIHRHFFFKCRVSACACNSRRWMKWWKVFTWFSFLFEVWKYLLCREPWEFNTLWYTVGYCIDYIT